MSLKYFVIVLALAFLLAGCVQQPEQSEFDELITGSEDLPLDLTPVDDTTVAPQPAPIPGNCSAMQTDFEKDQCVTATAIEEEQPGQCHNISTLWQKNNCLVNVARAKLDTSICSQLQIDSEYGADNTTVKYSCIGDVALEVLYTNECQFTEGDAWETMCWSRVESVCNEIPAQDWRELCIKRSAIEAGAGEKCLPLHGFEKDTCLEEVAAELQKPSLCEQVEDPVIKEICLERASSWDFPEQEPLTLEECVEGDGRIVDTLLGFDCEENELNVGPIDGTVSSICCVLD